MRPDRDDYMTVLHENIKEGKEDNFKKRERGNSKWFEPEDVDTHNTPFDFLSALLYPPSDSRSLSVSKNGKPTLKYNAPIIPSWPEFDPDKEPLTTIDVVELGIAYNCRLSQLQMIKYIHINR